MPEVILCKYCKQPINKESDEYIVIEKGTEQTSGSACSRNL